MTKYDNMEPHEILTELNKTTFYSPFTELKTLSDFIAELRTYWAESRNSERAWYLTDLWDSFLLSKLHIGLFVAAKNGKPLKKLPKYTQLDDPCQTAKYHEWHEAQKSVIFEGWEVFSINDYVIKVVKDNWLVGFCLKNKWVTITTLEAFNKNDWDSALNIQSLADLAAATTENPLKLK